MIVSLAHVNLGDVPTWATVAAGLVVAYFAFRAYLKQRDALTEQRQANADQNIADEARTAVLERQLVEQRQAHTDQMALLERQLTDQTATNQVQREALERDRVERAEQAERLARAQAEHVTIDWPDQKTENYPAQIITHVVVNNGGPTPIREVSVTGMAGSLSSHTSPVLSVLTGFTAREFEVTFETHQQLYPERMRHSVMFLDAAGMWWQVVSDGRMLSRARRDDLWQVRRPAPDDPLPLT